MAKGFQGFLEGFAETGAEIVKERDKQDQAANLFIAERMAAAQIDAQMKRLQEQADTQIQQGNFSSGLSDFNSSTPAAGSSAPAPINPQAPQGAFNTAISGNESSYGKNLQNPISSASGAYGATNSTAADPGFGVTPAQDSSMTERTRVGSDYADAMLKKYNGNPVLASLAHYKGPGFVDNWLATGGDPSKLPPDARQYVGDAILRVATNNSANPAASAPLAPNGQPTVVVNGVPITQEEYTAAFAKLTSDERRQPNASALAKQNAAAAKKEASQKDEAARDTHIKLMSDLGKDEDGNSLSTPDAGIHAIQQNADTMGVRFDPDLISPQGQKLAGVLNGADAGSLAYQRAQKAVETAKKDVFTPARETAKAQAQALVSNGLQALEDKANKANTGPVAGSELGQQIHQFATSNLGSDAQGIKELEAQANANLAFIPRPTNMPRSNTAIALLRGEQPDATSTPQQNINKVRAMANEIYSLNSLYELQDMSYQTYVLPNKAAMNHKFMEYAKQNQKYVPDKNGNLIPNISYMTMDEWMSADREQIAQEKLKQGMQNNRATVKGSSVQPSSIIPGVSY